MTRINYAEKAEVAVHNLAGMLRRELEKQWEIAYRELRRRQKAYTRIRAKARAGLSYQYDDYMHFLRVVDDLRPDQRIPEFEEAEIQRRREAYEANAAMVEAFIAAETRHRERLREHERALPNLHTLNPMQLLTHSPAELFQIAANDLTDAAPRIPSDRCGDGPEAVEAAPAGVTR